MSILTGYDAQTLKVNLHDKGGKNWQARFTRFAIFYQFPLFSRLFSYHLSLHLYLVETLNISTAVATPPPKPALSHATAARIFSNHNLLGQT